MPNPPPDAQSSPAALRNRDPLLEALRTRLPTSGVVLEIAAGTGEHAIHCAAALPGLSWQPTDADPAALASIEAWRRHVGLPNLLAPLRLDVRETPWPIERADAVVSCNMIHIAPIAATDALLAGAARVLPRGGPLVLYGPFLEDDVVTVPSNLAFDESLRSRDPAWGVRHLADVASRAAEHGLVLAERVAMPANNLVVVLRRS